MRDTRPPGVGGLGEISFNSLAIDSLALVS
jgi:hypothetical protein